MLSPPAGIIEADAAAVKAKMPGLPPVPDAVLPSPQAA